MKPLLPVPYTPEDEVILFRHGRGRWATTLRASGLQADIRDAALMFEAVQLLRCPIWSKRFASPPGGRMLDQMTMAREWVRL